MERFISSVFVILLLLFLAITSVTALKGPHPSDFPPTSYASPDLQQVNIPVIKPACGRSTPPNITIDSFGTSFYNYRDYEIRIKTDWCRDNGELRFRLMEYGTRTTAQGKTVPSTHVLKAIVKSYPDYHTTFITLRCKPFNVYMEVCARTSLTSRPLCSMTDIKEVKPAVVPEPSLKFRPPYELRLAPGDRARIVHEITNPPATGNTKKHIYMLRSVIRSENGRIFRQTRQRKGYRSVVHIPRWATRSWNRHFVNNATSFMKYALSTCPSNENSYEKPFSTRIIVQKGIKRLIRQDRRPPDFETPTFPLAKPGDTIVINVNATNLGGGFREGRVPTKLTYKWFVRRQTTFRWGPTYLKPIEGATGPTFRIENANCRYHLGSRYSVWGLQYYYVEVCNTYGCKRSGRMEPEFVSDKPGKKIGSDCFLKDI